MKNWQPQQIEETEKYLTIGQLQQTLSEQNYLTLNNGYLDFDNGKKIKFGEGDNTIKIDNKYGLWAGSTIYDTAPFRVSSSGSIYIDNTILPMMSKARAYRNANQSIAADTWTKIALNTETFDINSEFDTAVNYRFTAKEKGYYLVCGSLQYQNVAVDKPIHIGFYKNGALYSNVRGFTATVGEDMGISLSDIIYLAVGNYVELYTYHYMGVNKNVMPGQDTTFLSIHRMS